MNNMLDTAIAHWPFLVFTLIAAMVVQIFKGTVWTMARAIGESKKAKFFWWMRKTLPLHPVLVGAAFGFIPGLPLSEGVKHTMTTAMMYYAASGLASTWIFAVLKGLAKKQGIYLPTSIIGDGGFPEMKADVPDSPAKTPKMAEPPDMCWRP